MISHWRRCQKRREVRFDKGWGKNVQFFMTFDKFSAIILLLLEYTHTVYCSIIILFLFSPSSQNAANHLSHPFAQKQQQKMEQIVGKGWWGGLTRRRILPHPLFSHAWTWPKGGWVDRITTPSSGTRHTLLSQLILLRCNEVAPIVVDGKTRF